MFTNLCCDDVFVKPSEQAPRMCGRHNSRLERRDRAFRVDQNKHVIEFYEDTAVNIHHQSI